MEEKYRSHMVNEEGKEIQWRYGSAPEYSLVNKLFEQGRTKEWPSGSLEETVQNVVKSWEMELSHKTCLEDFRSINPSKFKFSVNGKKFLSAEETLKLGSYNALLESKMPLEMQGYWAEEESFDSSHHIFKTAFPRGFAWELLKLYSGPPDITFKFRHWGYMEGPYKGHGPTGEVVEFIGMAIIKENKRLEQVLVQWEGLPKEDASWIFVDDLKASYPHFNLEDKVIVREGSNDEDSHNTTNENKRGDNQREHNEDRRAKKPGWLNDFIC